VGYWGFMEISVALRKLMRNNVNGPMHHDSYLPKKEGEKNPKRKKKERRYAM
jgi:hypothetical protein